MGGGGEATYPTQSAHRQLSRETTLPLTVKLPLAYYSFFPTKRPQYLTTAALGPVGTTSRGQREIAVPIHTAVARASPLSLLEPGMSFPHGARNGSHRAGTRDVPSLPSHLILPYPVSCHALPCPTQSGPVPTYRQPPTASRRPQGTSMMQECYQARGHDRPPSFAPSTASGLPT